MKVILLQNVDKLGSAGDVVDVKSGYGRNFLVRQGMAQVLSKSALAEVEDLQKSAQRRAEKELESAKEIASKLENEMVKLFGRVGKRGNKLYGSITTQALATAIGSQLNVDIDKRKISIPEAIKTLGIHDYNVKLHPDVHVNGKVEVMKKAE